MSQTTTEELGINSWLEEELYQQYLSNQQNVDSSWKTVFDTNGHLEPLAPTLAPVAPPPAPAIPASAIPASAIPASAIPAPVPPPAPQTQAMTAPEPKLPAKPLPPVTLGPSEQLMPLRGVAAKIAENMNASLSVPTATSQRVFTVKVIDENRQLVNEHRALNGKSKVSYTHLIAWAIVRALKSNPAINHAFIENADGPFRIVRPRVNLGIAVDVAGKDGSRSLMVPNIKNAGEMDFQQFLAAFDDVVQRARVAKLTAGDFAGTTISLTNPGTVGTLGSVPRLMPGQGAIIATGAIDYPAEYQGVAADMKALLGLSKVMMMTCTYDHRVIQGAESGMFLAKVQQLLLGEEQFYEEIFASLKIPYQPIKLPQEKVRALIGPALGQQTMPGATAELAKEAAVLMLINAYRVRGHLVANLDPLGSDAHHHPELDPANYALTIWDLDRPFLTGNLGGMTGDAAPQGMASLREILESLRAAYCGTMAVEYMHIQHPEQKAWLQQRLEPKASRAPFTPEAKKRILERLVEAEMFENFLHTRFVGHKRFSMEGGEAGVAILDELVERAAATNVGEVVIGMAHRGRLTVLATIIGKTLSQIFSEFDGNIDPETTQGSGDVKYHLGASGVRATRSREVVVSLAPNPSHLEAVDPVVEGIVRPKQERLGDTERARVIPVLIHGDAAFAGQGVVTETLNLSQLEGYTTGGTVHLIINNQIGFTTNPNEGRSGPHCTDVARAVQAPILHVNGDDAEACVRAVQIAFDFRQRFKKDVVIDMVCYRRYGHNEGDDPTYSHPILYRKIKDQPSVGTIYTDRLKREKVITDADLDGIGKRITARLEEGFKAAKDKAEKFELVEMALIDDEAFRVPTPNTAADLHLLEKVIAGITAFPEGFNLHPKLQGLIVDKRREVAKGAPMDWATAEALAFGSLVLEGTPVRLSGQDSSRGTFSQRHLEYVDYQTGKPYVPMKHIDPKQARFEVVDSSLSEYAVMGFEFGYSVADPTCLVMWEAQFGDFVNGAQIMIDQFISVAEEKWGQPSGLVLLLPHGYEGQGPEHSSARIERFLQLCAQNNMIVANASTPAQYHHLLRRQMHGGADRRGLRKPLIVFTPKSLLRYAKAMSTLSELSTGGFREVLGDPTVAGDRVTRVLLCSGKVYYDLLQAREAKEASNVAIVRIEQLYPFPAADLRDVLSRYPETAELVWVQEEPRNMGPWRFVREWMEPITEARRRPLSYAGRAESASPATGALKRHQQEQLDLVETAFASTVPLKPKRVRVVAKRKR